MRFLLAIKHVFLSSVVNILLVFVPVGIAVRTLTGISPHPCQSQIAEPFTQTLRSYRRG
jgi:hypothetical protein